MADFAQSSHVDPEHHQGARFPKSGTFTFPTAVKFEGAELSVLAVNPNWESQIPPELLQRSLEERSLPSPEQVRSSLFAPDEAMQSIREWSQYACHDLRIVTRKPDGSLLYLATRRVEPGWTSNTSGARADSSITNEGVTRAAHTAPINGTWWPPGGRISVARPGSALSEQEFDAIDSALLKLNKEIGTKPEQIRGIYFLGVGETNFAREMTYHYRGTDEKGDSYGFSLPVEMPAPQRTINKNYVVELEPEVALALDSLGSASWIDAATYQQHRDQFCEYEQRFIDTLFGTAP